VTQQAVERALGKLLTDENFRDRFFTNPEIATWEAGFTLSSIELEALSGLSHEARRAARAVPGRADFGRGPDRPAHILDDDQPARRRGGRRPDHHPL